jgi:hypothetical protein
LRRGGRSRSRDFQAKVDTEQAGVTTLLGNPLAGYGNLARSP